MATASFHASTRQDPNTIYAESQNGGMVRYDARTGEEVSMQPQEARGEDPSRWNWDTPILISPHAHTRLYTASQRLYRSDDRGDSWRPVSGDLTRKIDRNALAVMGKVWGPEAVAKNQSTAFYSNVSAIAESFKQEGLLYVGTDDGLLQITDDGGAHWRKVESFAGVPPNTYVQRVVASPVDARTVFVAFDNHQNGDFSPYLLKSSDAGRTLDLDRRGSAQPRRRLRHRPGPRRSPAALLRHRIRRVRIEGRRGALEQDSGPADDHGARHRHPAATNSLVLGTFGRSIYVIDDYSVLRSITPDAFNQTIAVFPISDAASLVRRGGTGKGNQGEALYTAANPPSGTAITYSLRETMFQTLRDKRLQAQRDAERQGKPIKYPAPDEFVAEAEEEPIVLAASIADDEGRHLAGAAPAGDARRPRGDVGSPRFDRNPGGSGSWRASRQVADAAGAAAVAEVTADRPPAPASAAFRSRPANTR